MDATNAADREIEQKNNLERKRMFEERRFRARLRKHCPSEPWVEAQFVAVAKVDVKGHPFVRYIFLRGVFPPGGNKTAMVRCKKCGILTPPVAMEGGICLDHGVSGDWGPSPSAMAIERLRHYHENISKVTLRTEDEEALKAEIRRRTRTSSDSHP